MLTLALYGLLAIGLMAAIFLLAVRFLPAGEQIAPPVRDEPLWTLPPDRKVSATDIADLRLPVSLRGYRFAETDELLDRLVDEVRARDAELERLYALLISADIPLPVEPPRVPDEPVAPVESIADPDQPAAPPAADDQPATPSPADEPRSAQNAD